MGIKNWLKKKRKDKDVTSESQIITDIRIFGTDQYPVVTQIKMRINDEYDVTDTYRFDKTTAERMSKRFNYLLSGIQNIEGVDFD